MMNKSKIIFHADDLGLTKGFNKGIEKAFKFGVLNSTCIRTNGPFFLDAINHTIPNCKNLSVGLHLNLVEGKSHIEDNSKNNLICNSNNDFKYSFLGLLLRSFNKNFLKQVETELRCQFKIAHKNLKKIDHVNSHQHCCSIPAIFDIVCKIAKEYNVKHIRIPNEKFFIHGSLISNFNRSYILNLIKWLILKIFSVFNMKTANKYDLFYPDSFIGVLYTGKMNTEICIQAINNVKNSALVEVLLHPSKLIGDFEETYLTSQLRNYCLSSNRLKELDTLLSPKLKSYLIKNKLITTNFSENYEKNISIYNTLEQKSKKVFIIIDETNFYHPKLLQKIIQEKKIFNVVGVGIIKLKNGGVLQEHILKNVLNIGVFQIFRLSLKSISIKFLGILSKIFGFPFYSSCEQVASKYNLNFKVVSKINNVHFKNWVRGLKPDFIISSNTLILDEELINIPSQACINRHSSILPSNAGILPVFRSLIDNHSHTGVTIHSMTNKIDEGEILEQFAIPIFPGDTLTKLYELCFNISYELVLNVVENYNSKKIKFRSLKKNTLPKSYFSYPTQAEWKKFKSKGLKFL